MSVRCFKEKKNKFLSDSRANRLGKYPNVRGLLTKLNYFRYSISVIDCDLLLMTETWLYSKVNYSELGLNNFNIFRTDRSNEFENRGGGVLIGVRTGIKLKRIEVPIISGIEQVFIKNILKCIKVLVICV